MNELFSALMLDLIKYAIQKGHHFFKTVHEQKAFKKELEDWCNDFMEKNESTVISGDLFARYLKNYHLFEHILDYICDPSERTKEDFLQEHVNLISDFFKNSAVSLSVNDKSIIKEFVTGVYNMFFDFYKNKIPPENIAIYSLVGQVRAEQANIEKKLDTIFENTRPLAIPLPVKKEYAAPIDMIDRKIAPYKEIQEKILFTIKAEKIYDVCVREKHVVLLGEAGSGKTIAIEQLAAQVSGSLYYPIKYDLSRYVDQPIEQIIEREYPNIDYADVFLIFDAFDEIQEKDRNNFARRLKDFSSYYQDTIIFISSRNNFYHFANDDGNRGLFDGFKEYGLSPISRQDIDEYLASAGIDSKCFYEEIRKNNLYEIVSVPFYLYELREMYKNNGHLPCRSELMEDIIRLRFNKDSTKYLTTNSDVGDEEVQLFNSLEELAFSIQLTAKLKLSNKEYQTLYPEKERRKIVSYSGIYCKDTNNEWGFEHNNFREFLAAKYINRLSIDEIKELICGEEGIVADSWVNVLSFLILIRAKDDLLQFLEEKNIEMLVHFERNRINESKRTELAIRILNDYSDKNIWLSHGTNHIDNIAQFGCSKKFVEYLTEKIIHPSNFHCLGNALSVLSKLPDIFNLEARVRQALFDCIKRTDVRVYEKTKAMETIASLELNNDEIAKYIIDSYGKSSDAHYRMGILEYLDQTNNFENNIDLYIREFVSTKDRTDEISSRLVIMTVFSKVKGTDSLKRVIKCLSEYVNYYSSRESEYKEIVKNAIIAYKKGETSLFDTFVDAAITAEMKNPCFFNECVFFFDKTSTRTTAFMQMAEIECDENLSRVIFIMQRIADEGCYLTLLSNFEKNPKRYRELMIFFFDRFETNSPMVEKYMDALSKTGIDFHSKQPAFDWETARLKARQLYFNRLFDKNQYCELVERLVTKMGKRDISFGELHNKEFQINYKNQNDYIGNEELLTLYYSLRKYNKYKQTNQCIIDTISKIEDWREFLTSEAYEILKNKNQISVTEAQQRIFEEYCSDKLAHIDFSKDIKEKNDGTITYTICALKVLFFASYFDLEFDKSQYLKMLYAPPFMFKDNEESEKIYNNIPVYISKHLTKNEIASQIKNNISSSVECSNTIDMYLKFCTDEKLDIMTDEAERICDNKSAESFRKWYAIKYLLAVKDISYVYEKYLTTNDSDLFETIVRATLEYKDKRLKTRLEEMLKKDTLNTKHLQAMISLGSKIGLQKYYDLSKEIMKPMDYSEGAYSGSATEAISSVSDTALLAEIGALRNLLFADGFVDKEFFGLQNSLYCSYQNMAKINYNIVKQHLEEGAKAENVSDKEMSFCNTLIKGIEADHSQLLQRRWTIQEIKEYLKAHAT